MNRTKDFTTTSNITLEEFIIQTSANGWLLQLIPTINNFFQELKLKFSEFFPGNEKQEGRVKFFNKTKRFGFITTGKKDIFVHISGLKDNIRQNDKVIFEIETGNNGLNAVNVRLANQ